MKITNKNFDEERALYASEGVTVENCTFKNMDENGLDGESALKESRDVMITGCTFELRYPLWHCENVHISDTKFLGDCRASFWYDKGIDIIKSSLDGVKAFRESSNICIKDSLFLSDECFWKCDGISLNNVSLEGFYPFFECSNVEIEEFTLKGKYSFQYTKDVVIENSILDTKDAFWHSENVVVRNSTVKGEYLGWYSKNLKLIDCIIEGTQPLCYCENLILENCTMKACDLSFELSTVNADVKGTIESVKNPLSGSITADKIGEVIIDNEKCKRDMTEIIERHNG